MGRNNNPQTKLRATLRIKTRVHPREEEEEEEDEKKRQTMLWHILGLIIRIQQMYGHRTAYVYIVFY